MPLGDAMKRISLFSVFTALLLILLGVWFFFAVAGVSKSEALDGKEQLEAAIRRAAVACYAAEGIYPPSLDYLQEHYGTRINKARYQVFYEIYGENMMPEITVLEKK